MAPKKASKNGVALLLEDTGLSPQQLANRAFVENRRTKAGRETIRRYAFDPARTEETWDENIILDLAAATGRTVASISELAAERLEARSDLAERHIRWTTTVAPQQLKFWPRSADAPATGRVTFELPEGAEHERERSSA